MNKIIGVIPARYASQRFPGKPLTLILGKSLLQRTYESAKKSTLLSEVYIATDDERIEKHAISFGAKVLMTSENCKNGTERIADALERYPFLQEASIIVNIQGDHPCIEVATIDKVALSLVEDPLAVMSTAAAPLKKIDDALSPHAVKCVFDKNFRALYFSRAWIPYPRDTELKHCYYHVGIYAYRVAFLPKYVALESSSLQVTEDLEQLKVLENGYSIKIALVEEQVLGVDVPEDQKKVEEYLCR